MWIVEERFRLVVYSIGKLHHPLQWVNVSVVLESCFLTFVERDFGDDGNLWVICFG